MKRADKDPPHPEALIPLRYDAPPRLPRRFRNWVARHSIIVSLFAFVLATATTVWFQGVTIERWTTDDFTNLRATRFTRVSIGNSGLRWTFTNQATFRYAHLVSPNDALLSPSGRTIVGNAAIALRLSPFSGMCIARVGFIARMASGQALDPRRYALAFVDQLPAEYANYQTVRVVFDAVETATKDWPHSDVQMFENIGGAQAVARTALTKFISDRTETPH